MPKKIFPFFIILLFFPLLSMEVSFQNSKIDSLTHKCIYAISSKLATSNFDLSGIPEYLQNQIIVHALHSNPSLYWDIATDFSTVTDDSWLIADKHFALSPNHKWLVTFSNYLLEIYDVNTKACTKQADISHLKEHLNLDNPLLAISNSGTIISLSSKKTVYTENYAFIFHLRDEELTCIKKNVDRNLQMGIDEEKNRLIINDGLTNKIYDLDTFDPVQNVEFITSSTQPFIDTLLNYQYGLFLALKLHINDQCYPYFTKHPQTILALIFGKNPIGVTIDTNASPYNRIYIWNLKDEIPTVIRHCDFRSSVTMPKASISPDYRTIALSTAEGLIRIQLNLEKRIRQSYYKR